MPARMAHSHTARTRGIARHRHRSLNSAPVPAALVEQLLVDQLMARSDGQCVVEASATRASLLALSSVASSRQHLACTGRVCAQILTELGQRDRLQTLLRRIIRSSSGDEKVGAVLQLGETMMRNGQHNEAQDLLATYVHEDPYRNDHRFHGWIGLCCFHLAETAISRDAQARRERDAREHLLRALELNPREDQYVRCLSQVLLWAGKKLAAKNLLLNFCLLNPNNPEGFRLLCEVLRFIEGIEPAPSSELLSAASHLARCDPYSTLAWAILTHESSGCGEKELESLRQLRSRVEVCVRFGRTVGDQADRPGRY